MKKTTCILIIVVMFLSLGGCSNGKNTGKKDAYFYIGQGSSWLATYSVINAQSTYYDSLVIQYIFGENGSDNKMENIGPIEYTLNGILAIKQSSFLQELKGDGNFHTGSRTNANAVQVEFDEEIELTVKWKGKEETIILKKQD